MFFKKYKIQIIASLIILISIILVGINFIIVNDSEPNLASVSGSKLRRPSDHNCTLPPKPGPEGCLDKDEHGLLSQTRTWYIIGPECTWIKRTKDCDYTCGLLDTTPVCACSESESFDTDCIEHTRVEFGTNAQCQLVITNEFECSDLCQKPIPQSYCGEINESQYDGFSQTWTKEWLNSSCKLVKNFTYCSDNCSEPDEEEPLYCIGNDRFRMYYDSAKCSWWHNGTVEENNPLCNTSN